jgi:hypothetical protein
MLVLALLSVALAVEAQGPPVGYLMAYNAGPAARTGVAVGSVPELGLTLPAEINVADGDQPVPVQVSGDLIGVYVTLAGYEHKRLAIYAGKSAAAPVAVPLRHSEDQAAWMTLGTNTNLRIEKTRHGVSGVQLGGGAFDGAPEWDVLIFPPTKDDRSDNWTLEPPLSAVKATDFACEVLAGGPLFSCYRLTWSCEQARVAETVTVCTGESFAEFDVQTELRQPVSQVVFKYQIPYRFDCANTTFYPLGKRPQGRYDGYKSYYDGQYDSAPGWVLGWSPKSEGMGFAVPDRGVFTRLAYACQAEGDLGYFRHTSGQGKAGETFFLTAQSENLSEAAPGTVVGGTVYVFTQKDPANVQDTLGKIKSPLRLRAAQPLDVTGIVSLPAVLPLGRATEATLPVANAGDKPAPATARLTPADRANLTFRMPPTNAAIAVGARQDLKVGLTPLVRGPQEIMLGVDQGASRLRFEAQPVVSVDRVWPNKVLYANNEAATCEVTLHNWQDQANTVELVTTLASDLNAGEPLDKRTVTLAPGATQIVPITWNTGKREYGYEIHAAALMAGKEVDSASEYFGIASDWLKIMQDGSDRRYYQNIERIHNTQQDNGGLTIPTGDYAIWTTDHNYYANGAKVREYVADRNAQGIKPCFYIYAAATPWAAVDYGRDPSKILYEADGHPAIDYGVVPNIYAPGFRDWLVGQINWAVTNVGWAGCFLDVSQGPPQNAREKLDWQGKPAGAELGGDPDSIGAAWFTDVRSRIKAAHPEFQNQHNPEVFKSEIQFPKSFEAAGSMSMIEIGGGGASICEKSSKLGQWASLLEFFDSIRSTKHRYGFDRLRSYPLTMAAMGGDTCVKTMNAFSFACGFNTANVAYPAGSIYGDALRNYLQFATRYSALLYHDNLKWIIPEEVTATVKAPPSVRWKPYVYQRDLGQETDILMHLAQLPPDQFIYRRPGKQAKLTALPVTVPIPAGATLRDVWLLSPDRAPRAEQLKATTATGKVLFTVPDLEVYDLLVVRFTKGG